MLWDRAIDLNNWYFYGYDQHELKQLYKDPSVSQIPKIFPDYLETRNPQLETRDTNYVSFPSFYLQTQINQDLKHYVNENISVALLTSEMYLNAEAQYQYNYPRFEAGLALRK
jgi:asparagine synthase (glutamine-hydrolysing)